MDYEGPGSNNSCMAIGSAYSPHQDGRGWQFKATVKQLYLGSWRGKFLTEPFDRSEVSFFASMQMPVAGVMIDLEALDDISASERLEQQQRTIDADAEH